MATVRPVAPFTRVELAVVPEAAAGGVDLGDDVAHRVPGVLDGVRIGGDDDGARAERAEGRGGPVGDHELPELAAARRRLRGTWTGAVSLGATVGVVVDGATVAGVRAAGAVGDVVPAGAVVAGAVAAVAGAVVAGSEVTAGSSVGVVGGVVAVACVEMAARPANTPTPAIPPAAIQRVAIVVRAIPRSRSSSGNGARRGWVRLGGSVGWDGIGFLPISVLHTFAAPRKRTAAPR